MFAASLKTKPLSYRQRAHSPVRVIFCLCALAAALTLVSAPPARADGTGYFVDPWTDPEPLPQAEISRILSPSPVLGAQSINTLSKAAELYRKIVLAGGFQRIASGAPLKEGMTGMRVEQLRARLIATRDLPGQYRAPQDIPSESGKGPHNDASKTAVFDEEDKAVERVTRAGEAPGQDFFDHDMHRALRAFQLRHGLSPDGIASGETLKALNVSAEERYAIILSNLERLKRLPKTLGARYVHVNIAGAELETVQNGKTSMRRRVVVGQPSRATPELISDITYLTFNPTWTIPPSIARKDIIPKARLDKNYLRDKNIRVFAGWDKNMREIDSTTIDWSRPEAANYRLRQDSGSNNSLGTTRIQFANAYSVYLHDTPAQSLFERYERAYSSGCVRVEHIADVAEWLLEGTPGKDRSTIERMIAGKALVTASLSKSVPIYMTYLTVWVDGTGRVQFRDDIYKRDRKTIGKKNIVNNSNTGSNTGNNNAKNTNISAVPGLKPRTDVAVVAKSKSALPVKTAVDKTKAAEAETASQKPQPRMHESTGQGMAVFDDGVL